MVTPASQWLCKPSQKLEIFKGLEGIFQKNYHFVSKWAIFAENYKD